MLINQIREELELLETLTFNKTDSQQKQMLKEKYNLRPSTFEYTEDDWGNVIIICSKGTFDNLEYYVGLEYDREFLEYKFEFNNKIIVSYCGSERAEQLLKNLQNSKEG